MIHKNERSFIQTLAEEAERETVDYIMEGMRKTFGKRCPSRRSVIVYLKNTERGATLTVREQLIVIHKLLEVSEIDFRTMCDLVRYRMFRDAGIVKTVDDFLKLLHPSDEKEGSG